MNLLSLLLPYAAALTLTLIIEGFLCLLFLKDKSWLRFTCLVNLFTNPLVNVLYTILHFRMTECNLENTIPWVLLGLEITVWLSEGWLFYRFGNGRKPISSIYNALLFSFVLNAATYLTGLLLQLT